MSKEEISINSNNVIDLNEFITRKKWNSSNYKWEETDEVIAYRHAEIKGKRVYCRLNPFLQTNLPFTQIIGKSISFNYEEQRIETDSIIELKMNEYLKQEIQKPKGKYEKGVRLLLPDPQFETLKKDGDRYHLINQLYPTNNYGEIRDVAFGVYDESAMYGTENGYYLIGDNLDSVQLRMHLVTLGSSCPVIGSFILQTSLSLNASKFFNTSKDIPRMKIEFEKFNKSGTYYAANGDFEAHGVGRGTIKVYNGSRNLVREYEINNTPFRVEVGTDWATGNIGSAKFTANGEENTFYLSDSAYTGLYIVYDMNYWNEESNVYLEGV